MTAKESTALLIVIGGAFWFGVGWFTLAPNDARNTFVFLGVVYGLYSYFSSTPRRRNESSAPRDKKAGHQGKGRPARRTA